MRTRDDPEFAIIRVEKILFYLKYVFIKDL